MTTEQQQFRSLMGRWVTGISVIAVPAAGGIMGMTANAVTSVSLEPLMLLVCIRNQSRMLASMLEKRRFSINVLSAGQDAISRHYGGQPQGSSPASWSYCSDGIPLLQGANANFVCALDASHPVGDHTVVYGRVTAMRGEASAAPALVYAAGRYADMPLAA